MLRLLGSDGGSDPTEPLLHSPPPPKPLLSPEDLASEVAALAAAAEAAPLSARDASLPLVSVIVPVHNGLDPLRGRAGWLDAALSSVLAQTYSGPLQVSLFDDASDDGTDAALRAWTLRFAAAGVCAVASGSRWGAAGDAPAAAPGGIGFAKNAAVAQSSGEVLVFLDADDVMLPRRIEAQVAALRAHPSALVGTGWRRLPCGATPHYEAWANGMTQRQLELQQYRETTLQMPTWAMRRESFDAVGGFQCVPAEDLLFFHRHLDLGRPLLRVEGEPLTLYRWSGGSMTSTVDRACLLRVRVAAFERRVLSQPAWARFTVWGAGRDGKRFVAELSAEARRRVTALADIDPRKVGSSYTNFRLVPPLTLPVVHTSAIAGPAVVCVSLRRADEGGGGAPGEILRAAEKLGLVEGETLWCLF